jgi:ribosomal protein S18 acetylase RimI-like enzyme
MTMVIAAERPDTADAIELIGELEAERVAFFVARIEGKAAGCGGVQLFDTEYAELKRMYVRPQFRRLGLGKLMLEHLASYTRRRGVALLRLETGIYQTAAIRFYEAHGFRRRPPFGPYRDDPVSLYYEKGI